jgi:hypothetical protein
MAKIHVMPQGTGGVAKTVAVAWLIRSEIGDHHGFWSD